MLCCARYVVARQTVGKYMIEIWKATGMDMNNVEFLWASEEVCVCFVRRRSLVCEVAVEVTVASDVGVVDISLLLRLAYLCVLVGILYFVNPLT